MCGLVTCRQTTRSCTRKGENESKKIPFEMEVAQTYRLPTLLREGCGKSKWKFKMAFAMKGGGGLEGVSSATYLF